MPKLIEKSNMAAKHSEVRKILDSASETEISITYLPGGGTRIDVAPHTDTPGEVARWKEALKQVKGIWKDRSNIVEEMEDIRKECDRDLYLSRDNGKTPS